MAGIADCVAETSTTTGTGALTLAGAIAGYVAFDDAFATGATNLFYYAIRGISGACAGQFAAGEGYLSDATTLVRDDGVDLLSGTKRVYCAATALFLEQRNASAQLIENTSLRGACGLSATTADATPTVMEGTVRNGIDRPAMDNTFETTAGNIYFLKAVVHGNDSAGGDYAVFEVSALFKNTAGTVAVIGTPTITTVHATAGAGTWAVDVDVSGSLIEVTVTGEAATDIAWGGGGTLHTSATGA